MNESWKKGRRVFLFGGVVVEWWMEMSGNTKSPRVFFFVTLHSSSSPPSCPLTFIWEPFFAVTGLLVPDLGAGGQECWVMQSFRCCYRVLELNVISAAGLSHFQL